MLFFKSVPTCFTLHHAAMYSSTILFLVPLVQMPQKNPRSVQIYLGSKLAVHSIDHSKSGAHDERRWPWLKNDSRPGHEAGCHAPQVALCLNTGAQAPPCTMQLLKQENLLKNLLLSRYGVFCSCERCVAGVHMSYVKRRLMLLNWACAPGHAKCERVSKLHAHKEAG